MPAVRDAMQFVNEQDAATRERFIERLEFRGDRPDVRGLSRGVPGAARPAAAAAVLDLGCGTGVVARAIAARDGFAGTVTGVDQSPDFIAAARRLAAEDGVGERVDVPGRRRARARPPGRELRRRRGAHPRQPRPRPARGARAGRARGPPGRAGRDLRRRLRVADVRVRRPGARRGDGARAPVDDHELAARHARAPAAAAAGRVAADRHAGPRLRRGRIGRLPAQPGRDLRAARGRDRALPAAQVDAWLADQRRSAADGTFFAACNYYAYVAEAAG